MKSNDILNREQIRGIMQKTIKENDTEGFYQALDQMMETIAGEVRQEYNQQIDDLRNEVDNRVLASRGVRQLTTEERGYYQKLIGAMQERNPKQAVSNLDVTMPKTVIDSVFEDLRTKHPLLSKINFIPAGGAVEMLINTNGHQEAAWGPLTAKIVEEMTAGFRKVSTTLCKLSAFVLVCKAMLDLGPEWMDKFIRETLYEMLACGMETGAVSGDGKDKPIGMVCQVDEGVSVVSGKYPKKAAVTVTDLSVETVGNLLSLMAVDANGKPRPINNVVFLCNPQDYYQRIMPATTVMAPDGTYRNDVMPYPMTIIQSAALQKGEAVIGLADRYFAAAGTATEGRIEYSDEYHFIEDERAYIIKAYATGMPMDNNAFILLDVSKLQPAAYRVETVAPSAPSKDADLVDLKIGSVALNTAFKPATTTYTATTTNAKNTITATPKDAGATIEVKVGETIISNGTAATWEGGSNTVTINVTAADGETKKAYTVTVTKN